MNENQLETFLAVVRCGSYSRAAQALFLSQPTVTYRVQALEEELGVRLFAHQSFQAALTPAGQAFLPEAQEICQAMAQARRRMAGFSAQRQITLGFPEMMLQGECRSFMMVMQLLPQSAVTLSSLKLPRPPEDVQLLARGEADIIFTDLEQPALQDQRFETRRLFDDRCHVYLRQDHPLADRQQLTLEDLRGERLCRYDDLTCFLAQMDRRLAALGMTWDDSYQHLPFVQLLPHLSAGGVVISNQRPVSAPHLTHVPLKLEEPIAVGAAWRKEGLTPTLKSLIRALADLPEAAWL